jgi:hypothetical protein
MELLTIFVLISSLSFFAYAGSYFKSPHMKNEFKRFGLAKMSLLIIILEILGALGLLVGLKVHFILVFSSLGLALLMFAGIIVRIKVKDNFLVIFPAFFYMALNAYIFWIALNPKV